ncbi:protein root UVB sensitive 4 isoform X1 [Typha latifolia]|uniref:protein root UVB sensitive 4 isoform X1 n=2 Tax=Typha latifolia TaxID=4733 RepID=UPI003C2F87DF
MQFASRLSFRSSFPESPWEHRKRNLVSRSRIHRLNSTSFPKDPILSNPLKVNCPFKLGEIDRCDAVSPVELPVVIHRSGKASRYFWDGASLRLVVFDQEEIYKFGDFNEFRRLFEILSKAVRDLLVPRQVQENYICYLKWKLIHRIFSSSLQVLATQAMFRAIGIGYSRSLASAAALNWVLKDGLGRLSRCIYTASLGSAFDTNLKRVRFSTSVLFSLSIGVELMTPVFPKYFLLLASLANVAKSISRAAYLATSSAVHRSFAIADNLGEVSAKSQIQTVCFDNLGLLLAALLNLICKSNQSFQAGLPFVVYPIFAAMDLFAIFNGLKFVHLQTLTKDRLEIILDTWIHSRYVPSPAEVSGREGIDIFRQKGSKLWPIRIGCLDLKYSSSVLPLLTLQALRAEDLYFICMERSYGGLRRKQEIVLCLREKAVSSDIIIGLLQACLIRRSLHESKTTWKCFSEDRVNEDQILADWFNVVAESKTRAYGDTKDLKEELRAAGWIVNNVLLNSREQTRYSIVDADSSQRR